MNIKNPLYTILSFDRFIDKQLTVFERMLIHQNLNQNQPLNNSLEIKISLLQAKITALEWKAPEYRYNQDRAIEIYNIELNRWEVFKNN